MPDKDRQCDIKIVLVATASYSFPLRKDTPIRTKLNWGSDYLQNRNSSNFPKINYNLIFSVLNLNKSFEVYELKDRSESSNRST